MINRHTTFFVKDLKPIEFCGKPVMWQMDINGAFEKPFETQPTEGEHDFTTCEGCQKTLKELIKRLTEKFEGSHKDGAKPFPFCCTHHSELTKLKEFNRADFISVPEMVARKIIYTNSHIKNNHQSETYYKDITDYIDYTVESFGQMPGNAEPLYLSDYFFYITDLLERNTEVEKGRKNRLLEFLKAYRTPTETPKTDFNILLGTYQKWLKVFPFEISFFSTLKPHFEKQLPILNGKPETNKYTGLAKVKMHTKGSLIDVLLNLTNNLLTQINTTTLYEKGLLTEPQKIKLELVLNERKMKLKQGYVNSSKDEEQRYRKILKEWFADEKKFIDEVTPIVKALPPQPINSEIDTEKYTAKHYLLAYLFECNAKGVSYPIGNKKELERIGNERMGAGKGNRFYKVFNEVINKDLNAEKNLFEIGGEYWRKAVIELSKAPELVENYLQSKQL
ncbi:MAG: hypothetical protein J5I91_07330 [Bacteroidetes bacterium]|nr:hypothetical protein [Bacteroidota bacterium]